MLAKSLVLVPQETDVVDGLTQDQRFSHLTDTQENRLKRRLYRNHLISVRGEITGNTMAGVYLP